MARFSPLRFLVSLLTPGGVLVGAAWALQHEDVVRSAAAPYAVYFCIGALAAAALLSWYSDQARLLCTAAVVILSVWRLTPWPDDPQVATLVAFLIPLNFVAFAALKERGVLTIDGFVKLAIVAGQAFAVMWLTERVGVASFLRWSGRPGAWSWMPVTVVLSFAAAVVTLLVLAFLRRTKVEQGLFWALLAMFLGLQDSRTPAALLLYAGTAGLVLVFAVLEHGYDIAYRDELTGLPGRRAFNNVMGQLGRKYAIAMCDVDHFKAFNDTYGHDAGDQLLKMVATELSQVGGGGRAFRYGGEEFLIVFRGRSAREAQPFVETIRKAIATARLGQRGSDAGISVSIGIGERSKRHSTPELVLEAADGALYRAKKAGRNCVRVEEGTPYLS
ncbi:MAG TPA: GGDEF domain-containing protein [Vicinamibacterales bacterium]|nr:GGDEF domain-containing protein [Vicinamibacterales bacterium]